MDRRTHSSDSAAVVLVAALLLSACNQSGRPPAGSAPPPQPQPAVDAPAAGGSSLPVASSYTVLAGDTVHGVANRFGVPIRSLIDVNSLQPPYTLQPGQTLNIPDQRVHIVAPGDTIYSISRQYGVDSSTLVRINGIPEPYTVLTGQTLVLPAPIEPVGVASNAPAVAPSTVAETPVTASGDITSAPLPDPGATQATVPDVEPPASGGDPGPTVPGPTVAVPTPGGSTQGLEAPPLVLPGGSSETTSSAPPPKPDEAATQTADAGAPSLPEADPEAGEGTATDVAPIDPTAPAATPSEPVETAPPQTAAIDPMLIEPEARGGSTFLWPVTGKVVSEFGAKEDGLHNDGINIAAPLGTPVRAAENGVVVYAGNELRGFGNMLLIRHADGWVSAYAHNESLLVGRGDTVTRGQTIARVGATGNVTSPQLHFELRRGTEAVDPREYLGSSGA